MSDEKDMAKLGLPSYLEKPIELRKLVLDLLTKKVFDNENLEQFYLYSGLSTKLDIKEIANRLNKLYEDLKSGNMAS